MIFLYSLTHPLQKEKVEHIKKRQIPRLAKPASSFQIKNPKTTTKKLVCAQKLQGSTLPCVRVVPYSDTF